MDIQLPTERGLLTIHIDERDDAPVITYDGWRLVLARGAWDDVPLLFVDTDPTGDGHSVMPENERGPRCRILLNNEPIWANPPYSHPLPDLPDLPFD